MFADTYTKKYDEVNKDSEDFSSDTSEYQPSPNRNANSCSESTTSSLGGDFKCISQLIDSKINSPASLSNLSFLLGNADFVASPTAIYKVDHFSTPAQIKNRLIESQTRHSNYSNTNQTDENMNDETVKDDSKTDSVVQNDTLKGMTKNEELAIIPYHGEENKENNDKTHNITLLNPVSPFIIETSTNNTTDKQDNVTNTLQLLEYPLITIT